MPFGERHHDVGVAWSDRRRRAVREIQSGIREADVGDDAGQLAAGNDLAERILDMIRKDRRLLDARAARRAQMQLELSAVDGRKKILTDPPREPERYQTAGEKQ